MASVKTTVPVDSGTSVRIKTSNIPAFVAGNLAQSAFEAIHRAWENPEIQADYQHWKANRQQCRSERRANEASS